MGEIFFAPLMIWGQKGKGEPLPSGEGISYKESLNEMKAKRVKWGNLRIAGGLLLITFAANESGTSICGKQFFPFSIPLGCQEHLIPRRVFLSIQKSNTRNIQDFLI
jgi:hypothetical protein